MVLRPPSGRQCKLPAWAQGKWEHVHVQDGSLILRDQRDFKTYTARCVGRVDSGLRMRRDEENNEVEDIQEERYLIYARTHCGDEHYKCLWLKSRGTNAMEFQIGKEKKI